jgi:flagellar hook-basal body complex protein FliE
MVVNELQGSRSFLPLVQQKENSFGNEISKPTTFVDTVRELIGDTNALQKESGELTARMLKGEPVDIHDVMIAAEKSKTSFELLMELRNKGLDLYREAMRIQV